MSKNTDNIILNWFNTNKISDDDFEKIQIELFKCIKINWLSYLSVIDLTQEPIRIIRVFANTHNQIVSSIGVGRTDNRYKQMNVDLYNIHAN
jgi:hypothetical protein